ncbi:11773_t:CDS:1, partial [Racocetra persica]
IDKIIWKQSIEVSDCYHLLFEQDDEGILYVTTIAKSVFTTTAAF